MSARSRCKARRSSGQRADRRLRQVVAEGEKAIGWFNCRRLREPYRIEGKKTMGIELAEQRLGGARCHLLPDRRRHRHHRHVEGLREMEAIGWIG